MLAEHLISQSASIERAERLARKADRLEDAGTPSESARNRAERARREVAAGMDALRARFAQVAHERAGAAQSRHAFDRVLRALRPEFAPPATPVDET